MRRTNRWQRQSFDQAQLELALELVEDVQAVYIASGEQTKRGYNQAFFKKLYILAEWDDEQNQTNAWISGVELTEPYALLLTEGLFEAAEAEAQAIATGAPTQNRAGNATDERSASPVSIYEQMAERAGFEPAMEFNPHTRLAGECLQPLGHLSLGSASIGLPV
jgi:hypothetical protein